MRNLNPSRRDVLRLGGALAAWSTLEGSLLSQVVDIPLRDITADEVSSAIERPKRFLKQHQQPDGTWPNRPNYSDGLTGLCTLALLTAGCGVDDEAVQKALAYLRGYQPVSTYTASLQTMVFCMAEPDKDLALIRRNVTWLESRQVQEEPERGMWAKPSRGSTDHIDNSMTHFAMLALHEAENVGVSVRPRTWGIALDYWRDSQNRDGSWGWSHGWPGTGSMTCAGIAAIVIASGAVGQPDTRVEGDRIVCSPGQGDSPHIEKAIAWLERNFSVARNPGREYWHSYYLYSLERMGRLTARRFIGRHDWYREGAQLLVNTQWFSGGWPSDIQFDHREDPLVSTSFSLIFLAKGRRPVLLAHLKHGPGHDWNLHRSALFNLTSYVEKTWRIPLTHQVVDVEMASVEDLLESPVLVFNGREPPQLTDEQIQKLRMYVDRGGFLFAEQCCGGNGFDQGFRQLMKKVFPEPEITLEPLSPDHPAWHAEEPVDPRYLRELWGIDVGCRTGVVYCPQPLSCYWELGRLGRESRYAKTVQEQINAARSIGLNVLAYATDREVKFKDPAPQETGHRNVPRRGTLAVANVIHPGGCYAAPAAIRNLMRLFAKQYKTVPGPEPGQVRLGEDALFDYSIVFLHGRTNFQLTPAERRQLRAYLERGGMMFADAICSSRRFGDSFRREMQIVFPELSLERVPLDHPLLTDALGGEPIPSVSLRQSESPRLGRPARTRVRREKPYLEGLKIDDRYVVVFSPYDVSCALDGHATSGCDGLLPDDALRIALNVLLYSCQ